MILRRLAVKNFRRFASFEAHFAPGLNVILGSNEEGKSTLREAITLALFHDPKTTDKKVLGLQSWGAAERFAIELEFEEDGASFLLAKDFQSRSARLEDLGSGETLQDGKAIEARVKELLGLPSRATFESTVRISQRDMTSLQAGVEIADQLQGVVTGGDQEVRVSRVLRELDKALNALKTSAKNSRGPLAVLPDRMATSEAALTKKRQSLARTEEARGQLVQAEKEVEEARLDVERKKEVQVACARRLDIEGKLAQARKEEERLDVILEQIRHEDRAVIGAQSDLRPFAVLLSVPREQIAEMARLEAQAADARGDEFSSDADAAARKAPSLRKSALGAGIVLAALGLVGGLYYPPIFLLLLGGAAVVAWELARFARDTVASAAHVAQRQAREKAEAAGKAASDLQGMLGELGCAVVAEFHQKREMAEQLERKIERSRAVLEALLAGHAVEHIEDERKAASRTVRRLGEQLEEPEMRLAQLDQAAYQDLFREISGLEVKVASLESSIVDLRVEVAVHQVGADEIHALDEELQELNDQLAASQERQQVLLLVREVLDESRSATMVSARDVLEGELGALIEEITRGRYHEVDVDPTSLRIRLLAPGKQEPVAVEHGGELSTGTVEQVYLAARLALAKLLAQGRRPPLILDDPFVTFDPARTAAVLGLCKRLSVENQVLLFTCDEGYRATADRVVELPALEGPPGKPF